MSAIYTESELKEDVAYVVQDIKKLSKDTKRFVGLKATFKQVTNSTAHVRITGNMQSVPVRSIISVKGFIATPVRAVNAHGFAVIAQNNLGIPVGRAYLNPVSVNSTHAVFDIDGKRLSLPLEILASLVRIEEKKDKEVIKEEKKISKRTGISPELIAVFDDASARADVEDPLPTFIKRIFPNINLEDLRDQLKHRKGVYSDLLGELHETIADAERANAIIRHEILAEDVALLAAEEVKKQMMEKV